MEDKITSKRLWTPDIISIGNRTTSSRIRVRVILIAFRQVQFENCQNHEYLLSRIVREGRTIFYI